MSQYPQLSSKRKEWDYIIVAIEVSVECCFWVSKIRVGT